MRKKNADDENDSSGNSQRPSVSYSQNRLGGSKPLTSLIFESVFPYSLKGLIEELEFCLGC